MKPHQPPSACSSHSSGLRKGHKSLLEALPCLPTFTHEFQTRRCCTSWPPVLLPSHPSLPASNLPQRWASVSFSTTRCFARSTSSQPATRSFLVPFFCPDTITFFHLHKNIGIEGHSIISKISTELISVGCVPNWISSSN